MPAKRSVHMITPVIVARWLSVDRKTVLRWISRKELPALNIGTRGLPHFRIFKKDLVAFMNQRGLPVDSIQELVKF